LWAIRCLSCRSMHGRYATRSTVGCGDQRMRCRTRDALGAMPVLPHARSLPLDNHTQPETADCSLTCLQVAHYQVLWPFIPKHQDLFHTFRTLRIGHHPINMKEPCHGECHCVHHGGDTAIQAAERRLVHPIEQVNIFRTTSHHLSESYLPTAPGSVHIFSPIHRSATTPVHQAVRQVSASLLWC